MCTALRKEKKEADRGWSPLPDLFWDVHKVHLGREVSLFFSPGERMRWAYWFSFTPEHHRRKLKSRLQVWSLVVSFWLTEMSQVVTPIAGSVSALAHKSDSKRSAFGFAVALFLIFHSCRFTWRQMQEVFTIWHQLSWIMPSLSRLHSRTEELFSVERRKHYLYSETTPLNNTVLFAKRKWYVIESLFHNELNDVFQAA